MGNAGACCNTQDGGGTVEAVTQASGEQGGFGMSPAVQKATPLPQVSAVPGTLELTFDTGSDGPEQSILFDKRPLGIDFYRQMPMSVKRTHPGGAAEAMGVMDGWTLSKINGVTMADKSVAEAQVILKHGALVLPSKS
mmetsp:Transcript_3460/g.11579  ORF Transcript_3460/g.11579 Transcript_3460/m.11579 type:complete len:138 (+) Transcript_3460:74-487(+)